MPFEKKDYQLVIFWCLHPIEVSSGDHVTGPIDLLHLQIKKGDRGKYFAERGSFREGHFWGAPGQNFLFLEGKFENIKISRKTLNIFC